MSRRARPRVALAGVLLCAAVLVYATLHWFVPALNKEHPVYSSTPSLQGLYARDAVWLRPGSRGCVTDVWVEPDARIARFHIFTIRKRPARLRLEVSGDGYRAVRDLRTYRPVPDDAFVTMPLPARRGPVYGRACVENRSRYDTIGLIGTNEARSLVPAVTRVNGRPNVKGLDVDLAFLQGRSETLPAASGLAVRRASTLTGGVAPPWVLWVLAALVLVGIPLATLGIVWRSLADDDARQRG